MVPSVIALSILLSPASLWPSLFHLRSLWLKHDLATAILAPSHGNTTSEDSVAYGLPPVVTVVPTAEQQAHSIHRFESAGVRPSYNLTIQPCG